MSGGHFDEGHEPKRHFPARKQYPTMPGWFPTKKAPGQMIRTRLPLMMDGLIHIDTDPKCVRISPYPLSIRFFAHGADGRFKVVQHVPDIGVKMADGSEVYIDFVPVNIQGEHPDFERWEGELREAFREQYNASYAVHDELCIHIKPRFGNLQTIWKHVLDGVDIEAVVAVRKVLYRLISPTTIAEVREAAALPILSMTWGRDAAAHSVEMNDCDRAFSALMQLVYEGEVQVELSRPFCDDTLVHGRTRR